MTTAAALRHSTRVDRSELALNVDVLGPLVLRVDGREVEVPGPRRRALLAVLALAGGRPVSARRLVEVLWPDDPPENATASLQNHISRLRSHLRPHDDRLSLAPAGYQLRLDENELDADAARRLAPADPGAALALWRGPSLAGFEDVAELDAESVGLDALRDDLVDEDLERRLRTGDPTVPADAAQASAAAPYRERTVLVLIRALAAAGRVADAMDAAAGFRARLAEETGLDPTPALGELEQLVASGAIDRPQQRRGVVRPDGPMVGRTQEREEVQRLLDGRALVTLTGPGGVGKTRLAAEVAADHAADSTADQDVVAVPLAAVDHPVRVPEAVASAVGLRLTAPGHEDIATALADRRLLLVLDNCEHVADACRDLVAALRRRAPGVQVLATSRITLDLPDEYVVRLQPLPVPHSDAEPDAIRRQSSVRAFVEHVRRRDPGYALDDDELPDLLEILRRLDGLPLGIELAARQRVLMPMAAVRERLDRSLDLGAGRSGSEDRRQRTLRATIDSSYALLPPAEKDLLRAIAPFPGGVDLPTVESLADTGAGDPVDLLHRLVDASLLVADATSGRYRLLYTVRAYLLDLLRESGGHDEAHRAFVERCVHVAEEICAAARTRQEAMADRRLRAEMANFRAARDLAGTDHRVRISVAVSDATTWRDLHEAWTWALDLADDPALVGRPDHADVLAAAGDASRLLGDLDAAVRYAGRATELAAPGTPTWARARGVDAVVAHYRGDFDHARTAWEEAGEIDGHDRCSFVASAALAAAYGGETELAQDLLGRATPLATCSSHDAFLAYVRGELALGVRPEIAVDHYRGAIATAAAVGCSFIEGVSRVSLAAALVRVDDLTAAATEFRGLIDHWRATGQQTQLWTTVRNAAQLLSVVGRTRTAALLLLCADSAPGAAAVDARIAGRSGRTYTPVESLVPADELTALRAELVSRGTAAILDQALGELAELPSPPDSASR